MNEVTKINEPATAVQFAQYDSQSPMIAMIERVLLNPDLPMERVSMAMDQLERQMDKAAEQAFNKSFAAAMAEMPNIPKGGKNKHSGNSYSTLDDLIQTTRPVLSRFGLSLNWEQSEDDGRLGITAVVRHELGHKITTTQKGVRDNGKQMNILQGGGSTETYLKRYTGFAILGLSSGDDIDDDGVASSGGLITAEQFVTLRDKAEMAGVSEDDICTAYKAPSFQQFPAASIASAIKRLDATIAKKAEAND